jgi:hypothetical protein
MEMADDEALAAALASAGARASAARVVEAAAPWRRPDGGYRFTSRMRYRVVRPSRSDR